MSAEIRVNGKTYRQWKQVDATRSLDDFAGEVRLVTTIQPNNQSVVKQGDLIEILIDGIFVFTGYIEKVSDSESKTDHDISFRARDSIADLIDSSVPDNVKNLDGVRTFAELCQLCVDGLGLSSSVEVIDEVGATFDDSKKLKSGETGQTVGDFLNENARIVQVFLNTDGRGNILIRRPSGKLKTVIQNIPGARNNNVKKSNIDSDNSERFYRYRVFSNSSLTSTDTDVNDINNKGEAFDPDIRKSRVMDKIAEKPMTKDECQRAADEEANIRRARSFLYKCEIAGFSANGELWEPGKEVNVKDELKGVIGMFQVNTVKWTFSGNGEISEMSITLPDKGTVEATPTTAIKRASTAASTYLVVSGDTLSQIAVDLGVRLSEVIAANPQISNPDLIFPDQQINIPTTGGST